MPKTSKQISKEMKNLKSDKEIWKYVLENKDEESMPPVMLDNDDTFWNFDDERDEYIQVDYLGWGDGIFSLLSALGINHEGV